MYSWREMACGKKDISRISYRIYSPGIKAARAPQIKASLLICYLTIYRESPSRLPSRKWRKRDHQDIRHSHSFPLYLYAPNRPSQSVLAYSHLHIHVGYVNSRCLKFRSSESTCLRIQFTNEAIKASIFALSLAENCLLKESSVSLLYSRFYSFIFLPNTLLTNYYIFNEITELI